MPAAPPYGAIAERYIIQQLLRTNAFTSSTAQGLEGGPGITSDLPRGWSYGDDGTCRGALEPLVHALTLSTYLPAWRTVTLHAGHSHSNR